MLKQKTSALKFRRELIILRHAHRETKPNRLRDNGLSPKGKLQAETFEKLFRKKWKGQKAILLSSPKKRCKETLMPLSKTLRTPIQLLPDLLEQNTQHGETLEKVSNRVKSYLLKWRLEKSPLTVLCTHGDWIEEFFRIETGKPRTLSKGAFAVFSLKSSLKIFDW